MAQLVNDYVKLEDSFKDRVLDTDGVFENLAFGQTRLSIT